MKTKLFNLFLSLFMLCALHANAEVKIQSLNGTINLANMTEGEETRVVIFAGGNGGYQSFIKKNSATQYSHNTGVSTTSIIDGTDRTNWVFYVKRTGNTITIKDCDGKYWSAVNADNNVSATDTEVNAATFTYVFQNEANGQYKLTYTNGGTPYNLVRNAGPIKLAANGTNWVYAQFYTFTAQGDGGNESSASSNWAVTMPENVAITVSSTPANTVSAATEAEDNSHWYVMQQTRDGLTPVYDCGLGNNISRTSDALGSYISNGSTLTEEHAKYLIRLVPGKFSGTYHLQFATGRYWGYDHNGDLRLNGAGTPIQAREYSEEDIDNYIVYNKSNTNQKIGISLTLDGTTHSGKLDNNGKGYGISYWGSGVDSNTAGNNTWSFYPVDFAEVEIPGPALTATLVNGVWTMPSLSDGKFASNTTWYTIANMQTNQTGYISTSYTNGNFLATTNTTKDISANGLWCIIGNTSDGFKIYNKAQGPGKVLSNNANTASGMVDASEENNTIFSFAERTTGAQIWNIKNGTSGNNYWCGSGNKLGHWAADAAANDNNCRFIFEEVDRTCIKLSTESEKHYYTMRNVNNPTKYASFRSESQYLAIDQPLGNNSVFYFTEATGTTETMAAVNVHNYTADPAMTMNDWNRWATTGAKTWYVKNAGISGVTGNHYFISTDADFNGQTCWNYNAANLSVMSWSGGTDKGSAWFMEEVQEQNYTIRIVGAESADYAIYNQGTTYHDGDEITGFFFNIDNFTTDEAGSVPFPGVLTTEDNELVFSFNEFHTVTPGTRPEYINDCSLWYNEPATKTGVSDPWMEYALPMGNGQIGATIVGGLMTDEIQFNEKTLWEGTPTNGSSVGQGYYQNFGSVLVKSQNGAFSISNDSKPANNYTRYLDIIDGVAGVNFSSTTGTDYTRRYFTSMTDKVLVAQYEANGSDQLDLLFSYEPDEQINASEVTYNGQDATFHGQLMTVKYDTRFRVVSDGMVTATEHGIHVTNATKATLLMGAATDFELSENAVVSGETAAQLSDRVKGWIDDAAAKTYTELLNSHVAKQNEYMGRFTLNVGGASTKTTKDLVDYYNQSDANKNSADGLFLEQLYFQYGRYMTIAANAATDIHAPSNLQGIWNDRSNTPFWHCDLHADINVEMNYWPADPSNLSEMHMPFLKHIIGLSKGTAWQAMAKKLGGNDAPGWAIGCENNIFGGTSTWYNDKMKTLNAWYCSHLWRYYQYTKDKEFLKEALPTMYSAAQFLMHIAVDDPANPGTKVIPGEWSPEHGDANQVTAFAQQTASELFSEVLKAHTELGAESSLTTTQATELQNFYDTFDKGIKIEKYSFTRNNVTYTDVDCISEWMHTPLSDPGHRHLSHLMAVYPFEQITAYGTTQQDKDNFAAAQNAILARNGDVTGWSMGWQTNVYARLLQGDNARSYLSQALKHSRAYNIQMSNYGGCYYNLFDAHSPFQIDGNYGCTSGVCEMLLQSYDGTLHFLPALPSAWANGSASGLKAVGNFTVNEEWAESKLTHMTIVSNAGTELRLSYNGMDLTKDVVTVNNKPVTVQADENNVITITSVKKGDTVDIYVGSTASLLMGDADDNGTVTVNDIETTVNVILDKDVDKFHYIKANMKRDKNLSVGDINRIIEVLK